MARLLASQLTAAGVGPGAEQQQEEQEQVRDRDWEWYCKLSRADMVKMYLFSTNFLYALYYYLNIAHTGINLVQEFEIYVYTNLVLLSLQEANLYEIDLMQENEAFQVRI